MNKLDRFFFPPEDGEELHPSDAWWFYAPLVGAVVLTLFIKVVTL
ncbi:hypothetical protein [Sporosarcina sp. FA9]